MDNEQKNELSVLIRDKVKMIKRGIIAVVLILIVAFLAVFFKGRSRNWKQKLTDFLNQLPFMRRLQRKLP